MDDCDDLVILRYLTRNYVEKAEDIDNLVERKVIVSPAKLIKKK